MKNNLLQQKLGSRYAWAVVGMLWLICFLNYADRQAISAIFPILEREFGFSKFQLGLIGSIFMWVYASGAFFAGFLSDRVWRKPLILGGCFFWSLVTACTGICSKFWQFLTVRALEGMGEAFYFPASNSLITDYHTKENRSKALSFHFSGVYAGTIAGSWFGAYLAEHYGWNYGFYFFGGLGVVVSALLFFFLKEPQRDVGEKENEVFEVSPLQNQPPSISHQQVEEETKLGIVATLRYLLVRPAVVLMILAFMSANSVAAIFLVWMPTFLYEKFHMTLTMAGCSAVIFIQIASAIGAPCGGWLADKLSQKIRNARVIVQIASLLLGLGTIIAIGQVTTLSLLTIAMIFFGLCKGGYDPGVFAALFDYIEPKVRGSATGLIISFGFIGGALGPVLVGAISTYGTGSTIGRMSATISASAIAYGIAACFLIGVLFIKPKTCHL
ncbi:MAG: hypothetical protein A3F67_00220 [Verrucomicrobia bacterium RIFCSPHIGHO2_12_FULL_41_10]|nr:MAG: hypothetical protein A3F67_00220 [Verrucomicrobia bacterium RIFCSPHIGHO2_12_FULL_41_10]HLB33628.1 MFS transporter [Chthoniobacterales bacterium]